jgi:hypothetical protein
VDPAGNVYVADNGNHRIQKFTGTGVFIMQWGSQGSGNGQFQAPAGVGCDASGDVYVADTGNSRIEKFTGNGIYLGQWNAGGTTSLSQPWGVSTDPAGNVYVVDTANFRVVKFATGPALAFVSDVGDDQGRQARLRFLRSSADAPGSGVSITGYEIYRRIDPLPPGFAARPPAAADMAVRPGAAPDATQLVGWDYVTTVPYHGDPEYSVVVPTLADGNANSVFDSAFLIRAATSSGFTYFDSNVENGYSVDNLPPPAPVPFTAALVGGTTQLHWGVNPATDFANFRLYRGSSANFTPAPGNLIAAIRDTGYSDAGASGYYYKLSAVDNNGNESAFAALGPAQTLDTGAPPRFEFALEGARPNPAHRARLAIAFTLPTSERATLELIDVSGRRLAREEVGALGAGPHLVGFDHARSLAPGLYMVRLTQGTRVRTIRTVLLD